MIFSRVTALRGMRPSLATRSRSTSTSITSRSANTESSATMSANPSWKAAWSGEEGAMNRLRSPSTSACVVSWTTMSCERHM